MPTTNDRDRGDEAGNQNKERKSSALRIVVVVIAAIVIMVITCNGLYWIWFG